MTDHASTHHTPLDERGDTAGDSAARGLELRDVGVHRGGVDLLDISHLRLPRGTITALTGPNGTGKTSLARILCGLDRPSRGRISLDGHPLSPRQRQRRISLVMHEVQRQICRSSVRDELDHVPDPDATLAEFGLAGLGDRHPMSLSGGQLQRLVVAAAVAGGADVVVFDEPTSGLDHPGMCLVAEHLRQVAHRGCVVLVITHDPELVRLCADRVVCTTTLTSAEGNPAR